MRGTFHRVPSSKIWLPGGEFGHAIARKEHFALEEIEERWNIRRLDTVYYAENGLLEIAMRVVGVVIETGIIETEPNGRWFRLLEDHRRYSGLLTLRAAISRFSCRAVR